MKKITLGKKSLLAIATAFIVMISLVTAASFNLIFNEQPYEPASYTWTEPFEIKETVDFLEGELTLTGSGYVDDLMLWDLAVTNIAPYADSVVLSYDYTVEWTVGIDSEIVGSGSHTNAVLQNEVVNHNGEWTPTIIGTGDIGLTLDNIVWDVIVFELSADMQVTGECFYFNTTGMAVPYPIPLSFSFGDVEYDETVIHEWYIRSTMTVPMFYELLDLPAGWTVTVTYGATGEFLDDFDSKGVWVEGESIIASASYTGVRLSLTRTSINVPVDFDFNVYLGAP